MCYSISSTKIILILKYQHITTQIKKHLTCKHDILQTRDCKVGHIKKATIIAFTFGVQLAYPVIIEIGSPLISKKLFETGQSEQRREGLTWRHVMKDQEFYSPQLPQTNVKEQHRNYNSRCHQIQFLFPTFFHCSLFESSLLSIALSRIYHLRSFLTAHNWRSISVHKISLW